MSETIVMSEQDVTSAVLKCAEVAKASVGTEKTIGLFLGCAIGEILLTGGTKEDFLKLGAGFWDHFVAEQERVRAGG